MTELNLVLGLTAVLAFPVSLVLSFFRFLNVTWEF